MAARGAQPGNNNAGKNKRWQDALNRALARASQGKGLEAGLDSIADKVVQLAQSGEQWAILEVGNRQDGKPAQIIAGDADLDPVQITGRVVLVKPQAQS